MKTKNHQAKKSLFKDKEARLSYTHKYRWSRTTQIGFLYYYIMQAYTQDIFSITFKYFKNALMYYVTVIFTVIHVQTYWMKIKYKTASCRYHCIRQSVSLSALSLSSFRIFLLFAFLFGSQFGRLFAYLYYVPLLWRSWLWWSQNYVDISFFRIFMWKYI